MTDQEEEYLILFVQHKNCEKNQTLSLKNRFMVRLCGLILSGKVSKKSPFLIESAKRRARKGQTTIFFFQVRIYIFFSRFKFVIEC